MGTKSLSGWWFEWKWPQNITGSSTIRRSGLVRVGAILLEEMCCYDGLCLSCIVPETVRSSQPCRDIGQKQTINRKVWVLIPELEPRNPSSHTGFTMIYRKNTNSAISSKTSMFPVYKMEPPCVNEPLLHCYKYVREQCSKQQGLFFLTLSKFQSIISFLLHCGFWWSRTLWSKKKKKYLMTDFLSVAGRA